MLKFDISWIAPIHVGVLEDDVTVVEGPVQALEMLLDDWPSPGAKHHQSAIHECRLACQELGRAEKAREAFMAAALEAGILIFAKGKSAKFRQQPALNRNGTNAGSILPI
jgi:hypothetical protein